VSIDTIVFDMDGVITTEEKYWACARLTIWELVTHTLGLHSAFPDAVHDPAARLVVASDELIYVLKDRAVNSNWDITFVLACIYMAALPRETGSHSTSLTVSDTNDLLSHVRQSLRAPAPWPNALEAFLADQASVGGKALVQAAGERLKQAIGANGLHLGANDLLAVDGPLWWYLHARFQRFYSGEAIREFDAPPLLDGTVIPAADIEATLRMLKAAGYALGTATGRPLDELNDALGTLNLLSYFDPNRFGTLDVVRQTEAQLGVPNLAKPHPLSLLRAIHPDCTARELLDNSFQRQSRPNVIMVGDSTSDVIMAHAAGCRCVGVLTGVRGEMAQKARAALLEQAGVVTLLPDITALPQWLENQ